MINNKFYKLWGGGISLLSKHCICNAFLAILKWLGVALGRPGGPAGACSKECQSQEIHLSKSALTLFCSNKNGQGTPGLMYFLGSAFLETGRGGLAGARRDAPRLSRKVKKAIGKTMVCDMGKTTSQNLINHVEY